jgi:hypothetical protein
VLVLGGIAFYVYDRGEPEAPVAESPVATTGPAFVAAPEVAPQPPPPLPERRPADVPDLEVLPLPPLAESDAYAGDQLAQAVGEAGAIRFFAQEALVARAVATVDALGSRQVPGNIRVVSAPEDDFLAVPDPNPPEEILNEAGDPVAQYLADPANAARYLPYVEMLEAVDAEQFAVMYRRNQALFDQAWRELGYADGDFTGRLVEVIDELLATPEVAEPYRLVKPEAVYLFADEDLEALSAGQKILLRMGSANADRVKAKLSEFRQVLD